MKSIGVEDVPTIYAFNKADLANMDYPQIEGNAVYLSAKQKVGLEELTTLIRQHIFKDYVKCKMLIPYDQGQLISYFNEYASVLQVDYEENGTVLAVECKRSDYEKYQEFVI